MLIGLRDQGAARGAQAVPGRSRAPVRLQGSADRLGHRDRRAAAVRRGAARCRREAWRFARLFHRPIPAGRRGEVFLAPVQCALERLERVRTRGGRWIAANRTLAPKVGRPPPNLRQALKLTEEAASKRRWQRASASPPISSSGQFPLERLAEVMERRLGVLVLMVDAIEGVSGAACRLPRSRCRADQPPRGRGPAAFRSRPRAIPHPHLGHDAAASMSRRRPSAAGRASSNSPTISHRRC